VSQRFPWLTVLGARASVCSYTATPDLGFVVDRHPDSDRVLVVSACSGHGFKHSAGLGEAVAELVVDGTSSVDLSPFGLTRLHTRQGTGAPAEGPMRDDKSDG
jgi:sarcosine oxidase